MQLLVTMAVPRKDLVGQVEGEMFELARIEVIDWDSKEPIRSVDYRSPPEHLAEGCDLKFTGGCPYKGRWFQASGTEIVVFDISDWSVERVISHPSFHDLHGVTVIDDEIAVVNTGLEMVQFLNMDGQIVREVNVASVPTWERFDRNKDYRRVKSTKPHEIHPNHAFKIDGQWWTTRCIPQDAINLENPDDRIEIGAGLPHDGIIRGDFIYFTTTNAHLVIASVASRKVEDVIDLNRFNPHGGRIGWCRGLEVEGDIAYLGFTRLRESKWADTFQTARDILHGRKRNSHITAIDIKRCVLLDSYDYTKRSSSAIFTLMNHDRVTGALPAG